MLRILVPSAGAPVPVTFTLAITMSQRMLIISMVAAFASATAATPPSLCPSVSNFPCLVSHSFAVYEHSAEHWWAIYNAGFRVAFACRKVDDAARFLALWGGQTDGEMAEGLIDDSGKFLVAKPQCFFDAVLQLRPTARDALLTRFCLWVEPTDELKGVLRGYAQKEKYKRIAMPLLKRVKSRECQ